MTTDRRPRRQQPHLAQERENALVDPALRVGSCNTPPSRKFATPSAGVDTARFLWSVSDDSSRRAAYALTSSPTGTVKLDGWTVGYIGGEISKLWAEGHPGGDERLASGTEVASSEQRLRELLEGGYGIRTPAHTYRETGGVARLDSTVNLPFDQGREGRAVLVGVAALDMPRLKPVVYGKPPETVGLVHVNGRKLLGRIYDYGLSRGVGERGEVVRFEDQRRYDGTRRLPAALHGEAPELASKEFRRRFEPLWQSSKGLTVASYPELARELVERVELGEVSFAQAERALGTLAIEMVRPKARPKAGQRKIGRTRDTYYRRRRELRQLGLVHADEFFEPVRVDMGAVLERALEAWS